MRYIARLSKNTAHSSARGLRTCVFYSSQGKGDIQWNDIMFEENYTGWDAYAQSKLANILFNVELSKRVKGKVMPHVTNL